MSNRRRIYLLRHGDVSYVSASGERVPSDTVSLSERGRAEAEAAGAALAEVAFDRVVTSALPRTHETADLVLGGRSFPRSVEPGLNEIAPGNVTTLGEPAAMRRAIVDSFFDADTEGARFFAGERFDEFHARVARAFDAILAEPDWSTLLLVAHGGVNRAILSRATGPGLASYGTIEQDSGCINVLDIDAWSESSKRAIVRLQNFTPYDPAKLASRKTTLERLFDQFTG